MLNEGGSNPLLTQPSPGRCSLDQVVVEFQVVNMVSIGGGEEHDGWRFADCLHSDLHSIHPQLYISSYTLCSLWDESAEFGLMWGQLGGGVVGCGG